jgi:hypothetical protein
MATRFTSGETAEARETDWGRKPDFFQWDFGGGGISPVEARSCNFRFWFTPGKDTSMRSFREEVYLAAAAVQASLRGRKAALFHGGGTKSEILLRVLREIGVPFEIFFLDFWGMNTAWFSDWVAPVAQEIGVPAHRLQAEKIPFYRFAKQNFLEFGIESPNALAMAFLAESISSDFYPLVGAGGLDRKGDLFQAIAEDHPVSKPGYFLPFSSFHVFPYLWSRSRKREGEYSFFQSQEGLLRSAFNEALPGLDYPHFDLSGLYRESFPEVKRRAGSTNWDGAAGARENFMFRKSLEFTAHTRSGYSFWRKASGCAVSMDCLLSASPNT